MGTKIKDPKANMPTSGRGAGTLSGAAAGAAAGTAVMPGIGTAVGAVVGAIGGFLGGSEADKGARQATLAYKYAKLRQERQAAIARRDVVRQFRMARATSMTMIGNEAGGTRSSATRGAINSMGAQFATNLGFFDADVYLNDKYQVHSNKAGKHAANANMINSTMGAIFQAAPAVARAFSFGAPQRGYSGLGQETMRSTNVLNTPQTQNFGWIEPPKYNF